MQFCLGRLFLGLPAALARSFWLGDAGTFFGWSAAVPLGLCFSTVLSFDLLVPYWLVAIPLAGRGNI